MSDIYSPDTPAMRKDRIIRANRLSGKCDICGELYAKTNLLSLKDGRTVCPTDFDAIFTAILESTTGGGETE